MNERSRAEAGFTLFEMLVVLVITTLMAAVLMQGFAGLLGARLSVSNTITNMQESVLNQNIPIEPLRGILPDYRNNPNQFRGQARLISGQTLRPLLSPTGAPTPFKMTLDYDAGKGVTVLLYEEPNHEPAELARWNGNAPTFKYRDLTGSWESVWPPPKSTSQTPWLIWIDAGTASTPLIAAVAGPHDRVTRLQDSPFANTPSPFAH